MDKKQDSIPLAYNEVNCFTYAFKLDKPYYALVGKKENFSLGKISGHLPKPISTFEAEQLLKQDAKELGFEIDKIDFNEQILKDYEWKIALYLSKKPLTMKNGDVTNDYHIIMQDPGSKKWTHKSSIYQAPGKVRFKGFRKRPDKIKFTPEYNGEKIYYDYVGTYKVTPMDESSKKGFK